MTERTRTGRVRLPDRRAAETRRLRWADRTVHITIGYDPEHLEAREIFYSGGCRAGSDMDTLVGDLCIALSVVLQHEGVTAGALAGSMGTAFDALTGEERPASILGLLLEELARPPLWAGLADGEAPHV